MSDRCFTHQARSCLRCPDTSMPEAEEALRGDLERVKAERDEALARHRDLASRLGFGDNITEPMADNDTIVEWHEEQSRDANEWQESQLWRNDCYVKGHPSDEDCYECDPALRLEKAEAQVQRVREVADEWQPRGPVSRKRAAELRAALDPQEGGCVPCATCGGSQSRGWHKHPQEDQ